MGEGLGDVLSPVEGRFERVDDGALLIDHEGLAAF